MRKLLTAIGPLDELLQEHVSSLGADFTAYGNHAYRVANFCLCLAPPSECAERLEKVAIAAAFHDLGIWTDRTFDYLPSSVERARAHLSRVGRSEWAPEITTMVLEHHKLLPYRGSHGALAEFFRRADWVDVTRGLLRFGLPRSFLREVFATWPDAGFHKRLLQLELAHLRMHPFDPLPMLKL